MKDDRFTNLEKDIIRTVGRILSSQEMTELKNSIFYAADRIEQATQKAAQKMQDLNEDLKKDTAKRSYPNYQPYRQTNYNTSTRNDQQSKQPHSTYSYSKNYPCAYQNLKIKGQLFPIFLLIIGILGILTGITVTVAGSIASLIINGAFAIGALIVGSTATVASIFSTLKARKTLAQFKRFKKYLKVLGPQPMYTAKEIAEQCSLQEEQVSADLPKLVSAVSFPTMTFFRYIFKWD